MSKIIIEERLFWVCLALGMLYVGYSYGLTKSDNPWRNMIIANKQGAVLGYCPMDSIDLKVNFQCATDDRIIQLAK